MTHARNFKHTTHFNWSIGYGEDYRGGRIGVAINELSGYLTIKQLAGNAMPARMLPELLAKALSPEHIAEANEEHGNRQNPYAVELRRGMSGCRDYILRYQRDEEFNDCPVGARVHISMYGKLNEPIGIWLGDLPPLFSAMAENKEFRVGEDEINADGSFNWGIEEAAQFEGEFNYRPSEKLSLENQLMTLSLK